jgi:hypothetical protein
MRKEVAKGESSEDPLLRRSVFFKDCVAGGFHDLAELDVRRARGLTCSADEALVEVVFNFVGERKGALSDSPDEVEAPAR